jgi:hypothetical protein
MTDYSNLSVGDVLKGIHETQGAIKRASDLLEKIREAGIEKPAALGLIAESTFKMKDHLLQDLADLETALAKK